MVKSVDTRDLKSLAERCASSSLASGTSHATSKGYTMGKGTDAARAAGATEHAAVIDDFKDQLLIALLRRLGGKVDIPVAEVDETGRFICSFAVCNGVFNFVLTEKH